MGPLVDISETEQPGLGERRLNLYENWGCFAFVYFNHFPLPNAIHLYIAVACTQGNYWKKPEFERGVSNKMSTQCNKQFHIQVKDETCCRVGKQAVSSHLGSTWVPIQDVGSYV